MVLIKLEILKVPLLQIGGTLFTVCRRGTKRTPSVSGATLIVMDRTSTTKRNLSPTDSRVSNAPSEPIRMVGPVRPPCGARGVRLDAEERARACRLNPFGSPYGVDFFANTV